MNNKLLLGMMIVMAITSCSKNDLLTEESASNTSPSLRAASTVIVTGDISTSTTWLKRNTYIIRGEVHVLSGVTIAMEDNVQIYITNGHIATPSSLTRSALIFNTGSTLLANHFKVTACTPNGLVATTADNGGLWFFGSRVSNKDGLIGPIGTGSSHFVATLIDISYLGHTDTAEVAALDSGTVDPMDVFDDVDGISFMGLEQNESTFNTVQSWYAGDDGIDFYNCHTTVGTLNVTDPAEDGLNMTSSIVNATTSCNIHMRRNFLKDRDIFDFEQDNDGGLITDTTARYTMNIGSHVQLFGIFGDQLELISSDLPQPDPCDCVYYICKKQIHLSDAIVNAIGD